MSLSTANINYSKRMERGLEEIENLSPYRCNIKIFLKDSYIPVASSSYLSFHLSFILFVWEHCMFFMRLVNNFNKLSVCLIDRIIWISEIYHQAMALDSFKKMYVQVCFDKTSTFVDGLKSRQNTCLAFLAADLCVKLAQTSTCN